MWMQFALLVMPAIVIASALLIWIWRSQAVDRYKKLIAVTLFLTFDLIVFGAFTRLTDSGLGCPDWPGCYSQANPLLSHAAITAAQDLMPTGPVTFQKAWIEMIHRYLAMSVGLLIVVQMSIAWGGWIIAWRQGKKSRRSAWLPTGIFFFVCLQGAFGAWTVTLKLQPVIVTTHLLLGMGLLALLAWSLACENTDSSNAVKDRNTGRSGLIYLMTFALIFLAIQIALGGWVSTNYAALACQDYPLCNGVLVPELDLQHGFTLWRQLGQKANGDYLPFSALVSIQWVHRTFAWLVICVIAWLAYQVRKTSQLAGLGNKILVVLSVQLLSGVSTVFFSWPLLIAVLHNAGAALLVLLLTMLNFRVRRTAVI